MASQSYNIARRIDDNAKYITLLLLEEVMQELDQDTPVDTGHAVSNWIPSRYRPYGRVVGSKKSPDFARKWERLAEVKKTYIKGQRAYISNYVNYIPLLNLGSSPQAVAGFVDNAIERAKAAVELRRRRRRQ